ncbi:acyl-CoA N-acyltransferase [Pavlovales sp. CCMP2436]|nr:acyl-CoA N-acyltransferase [Pavlovales sp. CCMP2436]
MLLLLGIVLTGAASSSLGLRPRPASRVYASAVGSTVGESPAFRLVALDDVSLERTSLTGVAAMFVDSWFWGTMSSEVQEQQLVDEVAVDMRKRYSEQRTADDSQLVVALGDYGEVWGCAGVELLSMTVDGKLPSSWSERRGARLRPHISNLAVSRARRRTGLGRALVRECEQIALAWKCPEMTLFVDHENEPAIALYETLGYRVVSSVQADKPIPRKGQTRRLDPGYAFAWVPCANVFLVRDLPQGLEE